MNKTKIETADYNYNPFMGCTHNCKYCYARNINNRFKYIPDFTKPQLFKDKIAAPYFKHPKLTNRNRIAQQISPHKPVLFVGTMGDLFCEAIPNGWINAIIGTALVSKHFIFMFYTKNPARYRNFIFPENCWLGTSIDYSHNYQRIEQLKQYKNSNVKKFVSIEPLLSSMAGVDFTGTDFVFVGAQTGAGAKPPKNDWINSIKHPQIYYKDNILKYLQNEKTTIYS